MIRKKFHAEMEVLVPWQALIVFIEPDFPKIRKSWPSAIATDDDAAHPFAAAVVPLARRSGYGRGLTDVPSSAFTRAKPECTGGARTKRGA